MKARACCAVGDAKGDCRFGRRIVFKHSEREKRSIRGRKGTKRLSHLCGDALLFDPPHRDICRAACGFCTGEGTDERSMTAKTAHEISRQIRGRDKEPGQYRAVDHPYGPPTAPELEEGCGGDVFRVVHVRGHSKSVTVDTVAVAIEDSDKSIAVTAERCIPGPRFVPRRSHPLYCPHWSQRYTNLRIGQDGCCRSECF